jgi:hypothetical protein
MSDKRPHPQSTATQQSIITSAMSQMTSCTPPLYDVTIICTTDDYQAAYWMDRLSSGVCQKPSTNNGDTKYPMVLAVSEDWAASGAGNGLGTLYAFQKACAVAMQKYGVDIKEELDQGKISAALFHTAGKGTRLAPLPASENNNKPGVVSTWFLLLGGVWDGILKRGCVVSCCCWFCSVQVFGPFKMALGIV